MNGPYKYEVRLFRRDLDQDAGCFTSKRDAERNIKWNIRHCPPCYGGAIINSKGEKVEEWYRPGPFDPPPVGYTRGFVHYRNGLRVVR